MITVQTVALHLQVILCLSIKSTYVSFFFFVFFKLILCLSFTFLLGRSEMYNKKNFLSISFARDLESTHDSPQLRCNIFFFFKCAIFNAKGFEYWRILFFPSSSPFYFCHQLLKFCRVLCVYLFLQRVFLGIAVSIKHDSTGLV